MVLYKQREAKEHISSLEANGFQQLPMPKNTFLETLLLAILAFAAVYGCYYGKDLFGLYARPKYNFNDFDAIKGIIAFILINLLRPLISALFFPKGPFSKNTGYGSHRLSTFSYSFAPMKKGRKALSLLAPFFIITFICLALLRLKWDYSIKAIDYNITLYAMYLNAAFSCSDLYNTIFVLAASRRSIFVNVGESIYWKKRDKQHQNQA